MKQAETESLFLSIVIPVYNGGQPFIDCLQAIAHSSNQNWELIVVDDGSTDQSINVARQFGATILQTYSRCGPSWARNLGATVARGQYLCFIDADCEVNHHTLALLAKNLRQNPDVSAIFGSYDDAPKASNFVAQYKNLFHHYVHQTSQEEASTFWAGCGAVKRTVFQKLNGFDTQQYPRPSVEDIDLGYRIKAAGGKIFLAKEVQVKHHKAWTLFSLIRTDVFDRGIPWTLLLHRHRHGLINDLNLKTSSRISLLLSYLLLIFAVAGFFQIKFLILLSLVAAIFLRINLELYNFFCKKRGSMFALKSIAMNWLYFLYGGAAFFLGTLIYWFERSQANKPGQAKLVQTSLRRKNGGIQALEALHK